MKAAVMHEHGRPMLIEELDLSAPGSDEVQVDHVACGICRSDLFFWKHKETGISLPTVLGHEVAGIVRDVGPTVKRVKPGDHVIITFSPNCGRCYYCARGMPSLCLEWESSAAPKLFLQGAPVNRLTGGFSERSVVPETSVIKIPEAMPLDVASLVACAVATGVGAVVNSARIEPGSNVLILGLGGVGLSAVQGARLAGALKIIAADVREEPLQLAAGMGATHIIHAGQADVVQRVKEITRGLGADYAFETAGNAGVLAVAFDSARKGGTVILVGVGNVEEEFAIRPYQMMTQAKTIIGCNYGATRPFVDFPTIVDLHLEGRLQLDKLITRRFQLDEVNEAIRSLDAGLVSGRAVLMLR